MADQIHHHPDGTISVRVDDKIYVDTEKNFKKDFGGNLPKLPPGFDERLYEQGVRHALSAKSSVLDGGPVPWNVGDTIIGNLDAALASQKQRQDDDVEASHKRVRDEEDKLKKDAKDNVDRITAQQEAKIASDDANRDTRHAKDFDDKVKAGKKKNDDDDVERERKFPKPPKPPKPE